MKQLKIGVFRGGISTEREISLLSGQQVVDALSSRGYDIVDVDIKTSCEQDILKIIRENSVDLVFIALHGEFGEDGGMQKILEKHNIPFTGSDSRSSYICMDKIRTLKILDKHNIPHPEYWIEDEGLPDFSPSDFPLVVKPHYGGSSIGVNIAKDASMLENAVKEAEKCSRRVIVERYIEGRELTVGMLGSRVLPIIEIKFEGDFFDFFRKYEDNRVQFIVPALLPESRYNNIQNLAYEVYKILGCRHFARVDLRIDINLNPYILELNSIPGLTSHSLLPMAAKNFGLSFEDVCEEIITVAYEDYASVEAKRRKCRNTHTVIA